MAVADGDEQPGETRRAKAAEERAEKAEEQAKQAADRAEEAERHVQQAEEGAREIAREMTRRNGPRPDAYIDTDDGPEPRAMGPE